ncbi:MAG: DUF2145 domain-containing protein [Gammaproteobacteria bacterium]|nr:DUF2145 domain-containing protein [Gammaproteobacteria bacterium]
MIARLVLLSLLMTVCVSAVRAVSAVGGPASAYTVEQIAQFSKRVERVGAKHGARVFLLARVGRQAEDLPPGIEFTHTGFAVYSSIVRPDGSTGHGYAVHSLYQRSDAADKSELAADFPVDFFSRVPVLKAGILVPHPKLQQRLLDIIGSKRYRALHNPRYSAISNPYNQRYQNCNEFIVDVIMSTIYDTDIRGIKAHTRAYFEAQPARVNPVRLLLGSVFAKDIATSDHQGPVVTATYGAIRTFLSQQRLLQHHVVLTQ